MRAYVLPDPRLAKLAGRFVWLDIDTEKPKNAAFVEKFPIEVWPTLLVIDPAAEGVVVRWTGTATAAEIERLALDGERAVQAGRASKADEALARADRLQGERRAADAAIAYREALTAGGRFWPARDRAAESLVQALWAAGDSAACAATARDVLPSARPPGSARIAAAGLECAGAIEDDAERARAVAALEPLAHRALAAKDVLADDRSWLFDQLSAAREASGDAAGAKALARRWLAFLEGEAARARTPLARSAFDGQRLSAARRLGEPQRVLPALLASDRALPGEYVPATNLASLYLELQRPKDALAAAERALALAEGPRRIRVLVLKGKAHAALGDRAAARAAYEQAVREAEELPEALRPKGNAAAARKLLAEMGTGS